MREEKEVKEGKEVEEAKEVTEMGGSVAAFFDVDGTLLAGPSLERRFFWMLRYRRAIPRKNYLLWMVEAVRLAPRGIATMAQANKMYLRGVHGFCGEDGRSLLAYSLPSDTVSAAGERKKNALRFFPEALEQVERHAREGALALVVRLAVRGIKSSIGVCATLLEEAEEKWTGRIVGEAMFGEAKARAVRKLAAEQGLDLARCYAYGDSASDRWLLEAVGKPAAVNASDELARIARKQGWPMLSWEKDKRNETQRRGVRREGLLMEERREFLG